jgi:hypothetical protein
MCLVVKKNAKIQKAKKDITVYKLVLEDNEKNNFQTPFQKQAVKIGETYETDGVFERIKPGELVRLCNGMEDDEVYINSGLFHSFLDKEEAIKVYSMYKYLGHQPVLVKCTIPKGAKYLTGWCKFQRSYIVEIIIEKHICQSIGSTVIRYDSKEEILA